MEKLKRHNYIMEDHGVYLHTSVDEKSQRKKKDLKKTLNSCQNYRRVYLLATNIQLAKRICIPYFRSIFIRTILPTGGMYRNDISEFG